MNINSKKSTKMKFKCFATMFLGLFFLEVHSQEIFVNGVLGDSYAFQQDSLVVYSNLGQSFPAASIQDSILVVSDYPYLSNPEDTLSATRNLIKLEGIRVFPNPVSEMLHLYRDDSSEDYNVTVIDPTGHILSKLIWEKGIENFQLSMNMFAKSIHFIHISNPDLSRQVTYKIMK